MRFLVIIDYTDTEARARTVENHRAYLTEGRTAGVVADSGPFLDGGGGMYVLDVPDEATARRFVAGDPYFKDAQLGFTIRAYKSAVTPSSPSASPGCDR